MKIKTSTKMTVALALLALALAGNAHAADAKENWENNCAKCHGPDGAGKTKMGQKSGVKDYTDAKVQAEMKDDEMFARTRDGLKDGGKDKMPAYKDKLSEQELKDLVAFVRALKK